MAYPWGLQLSSGYNQCREGVRESTTYHMAGSVWMGAIRLPVGQVGFPPDGVQPAMIGSRRIIPARISIDLDFIRLSFVFEALIQYRNYLLEGQ
jgi:hypothetical protein